MRFLGVTETCDLSSLYQRLIQDGHDVRVSISNPEAWGTGAGIVARVADWQTELDWVRESGADGIIIFESVSAGFGALQDQLRHQGYNVVGGSAFGDRLENDRGFAQELLAMLGFPSGHIWSFSDAATAIAFVDDRPARYVLKFSGPDFASSDNYVGTLACGSDVIALLRARARSGRDPDASFILMEFVDGVEMGIGAYFDGQRFLQPACLDWEHKRFFAGDLGELTGEMGTVATFEESHAFFGRTLALIEQHLRAHGHVGYVNLNTIVNDRGIWPLEFTCRFGYPGFAVLEPLQQTRWADLLRAMTSGGSGSFQTRSGFSVGVVITTPPFPYTRKQVAEPIGMPITLARDASAEDHANIHLCEAGMIGGQWVTSGLYGWTAVVTGTGSTVSEAAEGAYARLEKIVIPNARYRLDIGQKLITRDLSELARLGIFKRASHGFR